MTRKNLAVNTEGTTQSTRKRQGVHGFKEGEDEREGREEGGRKGKREKKNEKVGVRKYL